MEDFRRLGLSGWILAQLREIGIKKPTPVQLSCIPPILAGRDCVGVAKTGSGKTLAFALPILETLSADPYGVYALVLTPTRELAFQIADQFKAVGVGMGLRTCVVVGGRDSVLQARDLDRGRPHIVIATPGRLADQLENNSTFSLARIKYLVMDEADRLLEGGFDSQLATILSAVPSSRQTLLFTATNSAIIDQTIAACPNNPHVWQCATVTETATVTQLDQRFVLTPFEAKNGFLVQIVLEARAQRPADSIMVFTKTCKTAELLERAFRKLGLVPSSLHSMKPQKERMAALALFKSNQTKLLIATDVASRGLDIPEVELVINHNVPSAPRDYVHRVGRTARAGRAGRAVTLVTPTDVGLVQAIEAETKVRMEELRVDEEKVAEILTQVNTTLREVNIELDEKDWDERRNINKRKKLMLEGKDPDQVERELARRRKKELRREKMARLKTAAQLATSTVEAATKLSKTKH